LLGLLLSFPLNASAQNTEISLGLDEAVRLALESNLNLKKSQIDIDASGYSEKYLWSELFPAINANGSISHTNASGSAAQNNSGFRYSMGLGLSLGLNAGIPYSMKIIRLAHMGDILKYEDAKNQLSIQITKKFFTLLAEKNNLLVLEDVLNLAQRQYERNDVSFRNGLVRELAVIQSRLAVENARYDLSAANTAYANNTQEFFAMLGLPSDSNISLLGEINILKIEADAETLIQQHLSQRPDIARSMQEIERLQHAERQSYMQTRAPSLTLSMDYNISSFDPLSDAFTSSARLNIPVDSWIPFTSRGQSARKAKDAIEKAKLDLTMTEDAAKTQIRSLAALLRNSWDSITIARLSLEVAQRNYELTEQGFRNGTVESLALEDARNGMANARQRLLQSELSYFNMILDISAALNADWKNFMQTFGVSGEKE